MMRTAFRAGALAALSLQLLSLTTAAHAGPSDYVRTPIVQEGEREIDFKAGTAKNRDGTRESAWSLGLGYGVTNWWFTEFYGKWHKEPGERHSFDAWEWENKFQLTETGKYPVDIGFLLEIERPKDRSEGYEYKWGPLFQMDISPSVQANLNVLVEKHIRAATPSKAELGYQWQVKHRWQPNFEYGLQGFRGVGPVSHWSSKDDQSHILGPAVFGRVRTGQREFIKYNAALLFGATNGSPRTTLRLQTEYEF
jgi:hypothetical protein